MPHESSGDAADRRPGDRAAEDAAWRAIVANFGDRADLDEEPAVDTRPVGPAPPSPMASTPELAAEPPARALPSSPEEHFVPPPPPPVPLAEPRRLLAWLGLFGVPVLVLVALVARVSIASWLGLVLMVWFAGGFVFLVASMRPGPRDEDDDGAVV